MCALLTVTNFTDETVSFFTSCLCCHWPPYRTLNNDTFWTKNILYPGAISEPTTVRPPPPLHHHQNTRWHHSSKKVHFVLQCVEDGGETSPGKYLTFGKKKDMHFNCHLFFAVTDWQFDPFMNAWHHSCVHSKWWQKKSCTWPNTCRAFPPLLSCLPKGVS